MLNITSALNNLLYPTRLQLFRRRHLKLKATSPKILIWEFGGFPAILRKNLIHSLALNLRGFQTEMIFCDGATLACIRRSHPNTQVGTWRDACGSCVARMIQEAKAFGLRYSVSSDYISPQQIKRQYATLRQLTFPQQFRFVYQGVPLGSIAWNSFNRFQKGKLYSAKNISPADKEIFGQYLLASMVNYQIANVSIRRHQPTAILTSHGVFSDYAPVLYAGQKAGLPVTSWTSGFTASHLYYSSTDSTPNGDLRDISSEEWNSIRSNNLTQTEMRQLRRFMNDRYQKGKSQDVKFTKVNVRPLDQILRRHPHRRKTIGIFAHLNWDVALNNETLLFDTPNEWLVETVKQAIRHPEILWLLKFHPGEESEGTVRTSAQMINRHFPNLPAHIQIITDQMGINPMTLYQQIDVGVTLFGTVGVELAMLGKPTINAAAAHFAGKGFTHDAKTKIEYLSYLQRIGQIKPLTPTQQKWAQSYAYSYFLNRQVPLALMDAPEGHWGNVSHTKLSELIPGRNRLVDTIAEGIIYGKAIRSI